MRQGLLNKVRRGEVFLWPPVGYVRSPNGGFDLEPDEQARAAVVMVFDQFDRLGTARKVLRYLITHGIRLGIRPHCGPNRGQLEWREPTRDTVMAILRRPVYAGYYSYGERQTDPRRRQAGRRWSGRVVVAREEYLALIPDKIPAYISRERSRRTWGGSPRIGRDRVQRGGTRGAIAVGWPCGVRALREADGGALRGPWASASLHVPDRGRNLRGTCSHSLAGRVLDQLVVVQVLAALEPGALELSLAAGEDVIRERAAWTRPGDSSLSEPVRRRAGPSVSIRLPSRRTDSLAGLWSVAGRRRCRRCGYWRKSTRGFGSRSRRR